MMDNLELIDSLIEDCDNAISELVGGRRILWCATMVSMVQKLGNLKDGVKNDMDSLKRQISDLEELLNEKQGGD